MKLYKSYMFKTKDPILDAFHTALDDSGMTTTEVALASNVSVSTYRAWRTGKTRRPQFATIAAGIRSLGGDGITFGKDGSPRITGVRKAPARLKLRVVSG